MSLFTPLMLREVNLPNRICVSPMSQYAAQDGYANDWHFAHLSRFALGGAGLVFAEATAVTEAGRRTHGDLGLWRDSQVSGLARMTQFISEQGSVPGIQLAHAGRKASERRPWHGETPVDEEDLAKRGEGPWVAVGPTDQPYAEGWPSPSVMTVEDIHDVVTAFCDAAVRADEAGFQVLEVYAAHGFLLHQFYSPLSNFRQDAYGGSFGGRVRLCLEVARGIRQVWPSHKPLFFRLSATDWLEGGWEVSDTVRLAKLLKAEGVDLVDCSSGGLGGPYPPVRFPLGRAFQANLAEEVRREAAMPTMAVGLIWEAHTADQIIRSGQADLVALGREMLNDPNWALHAASQLDVDSGFELWKPAFGWWLNKRERLLKKLGFRS